MRRCRTRRAAPRATAVAAALAVLGVPAVCPGVAAADPGEVPAYRTAEDAEAVDGAASSADGPRLVHGRTYTDRIRPGQEKYYTIRLDGSSQPRISVVALPEPGSGVSYSDGIALTLEATDGTECAQGEALFASDGAAWPITAWVARIDRQDGDCRNAGVYNLSVTREGEGGSGAPAWPVELHLMREPGLKVAGSTEPPDVDDTPTEPPAMPADEPRDIRGGTGFNDAAGMAEGVWKDRLLPGETRFYRVPVDWGQALAVRAEFGTTQATDENGYTSQGVQVDVYNPARAYVAGESALYGADDPAAVPLRTPPVTYVARYSYQDDVAAASVAGWYYVAVHAHPELDDFVQGEVPVTLRTKLVGQPAAGPDYDGDAAAAGFGVTEGDREQADRGLTPQAAERSSLLTAVGWSAIGAGTVLVAALAAWALLSRRRAHAGGAGALAYAPTQTSAPSPWQ